MWLCGWFYLAALRMDLISAMVLAHWMLLRCTPELHCTHMRCDMQGVATSAC